MCLDTKERIADCVKSLMKRKEIRKITVHNIMEETHMSRQTFYYNFKDIYDVLEWIYKKDIVEPLTPHNECTIEDWLNYVSVVVAQNYVYVSHVVKELEWPKICAAVKPYMTDRIMRVLNQPHYAYIPADTRKSIADFLTSSCSYYLMDCLYYDKPINDKTLSAEYHKLCQLFSIPKESSSTEFSPELEESIAC